VLDFGLAKLSEVPLSISPDEAPTMQVRTGSGVVMGTAAYMSPEQARGQTVDARSDVFSLGALIYEMIAQRKPFEGETPSDMLAAVLKTEPLLLSHLAPSTPAELVRIVNKSLRKDREERYQTIKDLLIDLKSLKEELDFQAKLDRSVSPHLTGEANAITDEAPPTSEIKTAVSTITHSLSVEIKRHKTITLLGAAVLIAAITGGLFVVYRFLRRRSPQTIDTPQILRNTQVTFNPGLDSDPSLSPDGNSVAYSSDQSGKFEIYVKQLAPGSREIQLTSNGQQNFLPAWSPDGRHIAYESRVGHGIWLVPALGGVPKQLTDFGSWPAWSHDGAFIAFQSGEENALPPSTIWIVPSAGGTPKQITQMGNPEGGHGYPAWSPDGSRIAFVAEDYLRSYLWTVSVKGDDPKRVGPLDLRPSVANPIYAADGRSIYFAGQVGLSNNFGFVVIGLAPNGDAIGEPRLIMGFPGKGIKHLSITTDGKKLAYASLNFLSTLTAMPMSPASDEPGGPPTPLSNDRSQRHVVPTFSPDGRRIAFAQWREGSGADIWLIDADGKNLTQVTTDPAVDNVPNWFPSGDRLEFMSNRSGRFNPWSISLASGKESPLVDLGLGVGGYARLSPDGKQIAFNSSRSGTINVWVISVEGGEPRQLTFDQEMIGFPSWSPDGKTLATEMKRGPNYFLVLIPSAGGPPEQLVSDNGLSWPHDWSHDGDKILFAGERNGIWNVYWVSRSNKAQKQLTHYSKFNAFVRYPAWAPSGNQIVYEYQETTGNIWVMDLK